MSNGHVDSQATCTVILNSRISKKPHNYCPYGWMDGWIYYYHRQHNTMMSRNSVLILVQKVKKCPGIQSLLFKKVHCLKHVLNCVGNYLFPTWFYI